MGAILFIALCLPFVLWPFLSLKRDYFFFILYFQAVLYLHFAPTIVGWEQVQDEKITYVLLMIFCLLLFEIPLLLIYTGNKKKKETIKTDQEIQVSFMKLLVISFILICLTAAFVYVVIHNGLLYRRLGMGTPIHLIKMSFREHLIYRIFIDSSIFFTSVLLLIYLVSPRQSKVKILAFLSLFSVGGVYAVYAIINSRLETFMLFIFIAGIFISQSKYSFLFTKKNLLLIVFLFLSFFYTFKVAENIRSNYIREGVKISHFNPFYTSRGKNFSIQLAERLNGIDLMSKMTPSAIEDLFAKGKAWEYPIVATFGSIFIPQYVQELKMDRMTTAKSHLMKKYTSIDSPDYPSCKLVDTYGNFGPFGFLMAAFIMGIFCRLGVRWFFSLHSPSLMILGIFVLSLVLKFELSFISLFLDWVKVLPVFLVFLLFNPLKSRH